MPDVSFALIAGGQGSRLGGVAKGLLRVDGQPVIARLIDVARRFPDAIAEVLLVTGDAAPYAGLTGGARVVGDVVAERGAPGGVHAALVHARTPWVLAVGVDMPFVRPEAVSLLLSARDTDAETEVVAFRVDGRLEPLLALYRARIARRWGEALAGGPSFAELAEVFRCRFLEESILASVDPTRGSIWSVNTLEDALKMGVQLPR